MTNVCELLAYKEKNYAYLQWTFFFTIKSVSYVLSCTDFEKNTQKLVSRTVLTEFENLSLIGKL